MIKIVDTFMADNIILEYNISLSSYHHIISFIIFFSRILKFINFHHVCWDSFWIQDIHNTLGIKFLKSNSFLLLQLLTNSRWFAYMLSWLQIDNNFFVFRKMSLLSKMRKWMKHYKADDGVKRKSEIVYQFRYGTNFYVVTCNMFPVTRTKHEHLLLKF